MPKGLKIMNSLARLVGQQGSEEEEEGEQIRKPAALLGLEQSIKTKTDPSKRKAIQDSFNKKLGK